MDTSTERGYTAKLIDGPLEGKTLTTAFLDSGEPRARIEIAAPAGGKRLVYVRTAGLEFEAEGDARPTAADYRYLETLFD
jgi:hypothetical protein